MLCAEIIQIYTLVKPQFYYIKVGFMGVKIYNLYYVLVMNVPRATIARVYVYTLPQRKQNNKNKI